MWSDGRVRPGSQDAVYGENGRSGGRGGRRHRWGSWSSRPRRPLKDRFESLAAAGRQEHASEETVLGPWRG